MKRFRFGWYGDGGFGERMIQTILTGRKTATSCPAYDPEDAELSEGDELELVDKHGSVRGHLVVVKVEIRTFASFDDALAAAEGITLPELREKMSFANGRPIKDDEEMRIVFFRLVRAAGKVRA